jgi:peptide deformylase
MPILKISKYPEDERVLRERCKPVVKITDRTRRLIDDMIETMYDAAGVGLAAPQVFVNQRLFVYDIGQGAGPDALINPEIIHTEGDEVGTEGCLSIPRLQGDVARFTRIIVTGLNRKGRRVRIEADDPYLARVFQHEIDHLNGVLFIDKAQPKSLHWLTEEEAAERKVEGSRRRRRVVRIGDGAAKPAAEADDAAPQPVTGV